MLTVPFHDFASQFSSAGEISPTVVLNPLHQGFGDTGCTFEVHRSDTHPELELPTGVVTRWRIPAGAIVSGAIVDGTKVIVAVRVSGIGLGRATALSICLRSTSGQGAGCASKGRKASILHEGSSIETCVFAHGITSLCSLTLLFLFSFMMSNETPTKAGYASFGLSATDLVKSFKVGTKSPKHPFAPVLWHPGEC